MAASSEHTPLLADGTSRTSHVVAADCNTQHSQESEVCEKTTWLPRRFRLFGLLFLASTLHTCVRACFNLALVAMVSDNSTAADNVTAADRCPGVGTLNQSSTPSTDGEFVWNSSQQSQLLSAFYYGYVVLQIPGGYLTERFGGKRILGLSSLLAGLCTVLVPVTARTSYEALLACRVVMGLVSGPMYVPLFSTATNWAPKYEVTWLIGLPLNGFIIGEIIAFTSAGALIETGFLGGWPSVFYVFGGLLILWTFLWMLLAADSPATDPSISPQERDYIMKNTDNRAETKYENPPLGKLLTSPTILSLWLVMATDSYGYYVIFTSLAFYMKQMLAYDIGANGLLVGFQYGASLITAISICPLVDILRAKGWLSTRAARVTTTLIGDLGLASVLLLIGLFFECERGAVVGLLMTGQFLYGVATAGFNISPLDIAPMYTGTLTGVGICFSNVMGFVAPLTVGWIVGDTPTRAHWKAVFISTAGVLTVGSLVYSVFAKGEELPWAKEIRLYAAKNKRASDSDCDNQTLNADDPSTNNPNIV